MPSVDHLFNASARMTFVLFTALCITGIFASLVRGKVEKSL